MKTAGDVMLHNDAKPSDKCVIKTFWRANLH